MNEWRNQRHSVLSEYEKSFSVAAQPWTHWKSSFVPNTYTTRQETFKVDCGKFILEPNNLNSTSTHKLFLELSSASQGLHQWRVDWEEVKVLDQEFEDRGGCSHPTHPSININLLSKFHT